MEKKSRKSKIGVKVLLGILATILILVIVFIVINFNIIRTTLSVKKISKSPAYYVNVSGDFYLEDYLASGAKTSYELIHFLSDKITYGLYDNIASKHGCSGFSAKTPEGDYILAQNFDTKKYTPVITRMSSNCKVLGISNMGEAVNKTDLKLKDKFLMNAAPYVMMDGINEYGLSVVTATASGSLANRDANKITLYDSTIPNVILNSAKTVDEAIHFMENYNVSSEYALSHYLISDAKGNSALIEWVSGNMQVTKSEKNYQIFSNFVVYGNEKLEGFGSDRYQAYENYLSASNGVISEEDAIELLKKNTIKGDECWTVVYNLTNKTMKVTFNGDYDNVYDYNMK